MKTRTTPHPIDRPDETNPCIFVNNQKQSVNQLKCKQFYSVFIEKIFNKPSCIYGWMQSFTVPEEDWKFYFKIPFETTSETKLQSFQYKIINRIFACNAQLFKWKIKPSSLCQHCGVQDDIIHYFVDCDRVVYFWESVIEWWEQMHDHKCQLTLNGLNIIFGILDPTQTADALNFCLLLAKWYIFRCKYLDQYIFFYSFLSELKNRLIIEKCIAVKNNKLSKFEMVFNISNLVIQFSS